MKKLLALLGVTLLAGCQMPGANDGEMDDPMEEDEMTPPMEDEMTPPMEEEEEEPTMLEGEVETNVEL